MILTHRKAIVGGAIALTVLGVGGTSAAIAAGPTPGTPGSPPAAPADHKPHLDGKIASVTDAGFTLVDREGFTRTVATSSTTAYKSAGKTATRAILVVGKQVRSEGAVASDKTTLNAALVEVGMPTPPAPPAPGDLPKPPADAPKPPSGAPTPPSGAPSAPSTATTAPDSAASGS